jgi:hypothetical protein
MCANPRHSRRRSHYILYRIFPSTPRAVSVIDCRERKIFSADKNLMQKFCRKKTHPNLYEKCGAGTPARGVIPQPPRFYQRGEGSPRKRSWPLIQTAPTIYPALPPSPPRHLYSSFVLIPSTESGAATFHAQAYIPTQPAQAVQEARIPHAHEDPGRPKSSISPPRQGAQAGLCETRLPRIGSQNVARTLLSARRSSEAELDLGEPDLAEPGF